MHLGSLNMGLAVILVLAIAIALGAAFAAPIVAVPVFIVLFGAFLIWRGMDRSARGSRRGGSRVPTTEEASAHPVRDSGIADAERAPADAERRGHTAA